MAQIVNKRTTTSEVIIYMPEDVIKSVSYDINVEEALKGVVYSDKFAFSVRMFLITEIVLAHESSAMITQSSLDDLISKLTRDKEN